MFSIVLSIAGVEIKLCLTKMVNFSKVKDI